MGAPQAPIICIYPRHRDKAWRDVTKRLLKRHLIVILLLPKWKEDNLLCSKGSHNNQKKSSVNAKKSFRNNVLCKKNDYFCADKYAFSKKKNEQLFNDIQSFWLISTQWCSAPPCGGCRGIASSYYGVIGRHSSCLIRNVVFYFTTISNKINYKNQRYEK